jgi:CheY-like chemotaxis protein
MAWPKPLILVVEDDTTTRELAAMVLESGGYRVSEASSADQAVDALTLADNIALVFSDIQMPGTMSGVELAHSLHQRNDRLPIILTSGLRLNQHLDYPTWAPFLEKPYTALGLLSAISKCLSRPLTRNVGISRHK